MKAKNQACKRHTHAHSTLCDTDGGLQVDVHGCEGSGILKRCVLTIRLGDALDLILLLDSVAVRGALRRVDQLVSQALSNRLDAAERGLPRLCITGKRIWLAPTGPGWSSDANEANASR